MLTTVRKLFGKPSMIGISIMLLIKKGKKKKAEYDEMYVI
jgi:hypothetical protein